MDVGTALIQASMEERALSYLWLHPTDGRKSLVFNAVSGALKDVTISLSRDGTRFSWWEG